MHHSPPLRADQQACWCVQAQQCHLPPPPQPGTQYMAHARGRGSMPGGRQPGRGCDPNDFVLVLGRIIPLEPTPWPSRLSWHTAADGGSASMLRIGKDPECITCGVRLLDNPAVNSSIDANLQEGGLRRQGPADDAAVAAAAADAAAKRRRRLRRAAAAAAGRAAGDAAVCRQGRRPRPRRWQRRWRRPRPRPLRRCRGRRLCGDVARGTRPQWHALAACRRDAALACM